MSAALERSGGGGDGKLESEAGAATGAGAFSGQVAAHLFGGESPAVEAKAVPVFAGGETVMKDPRQVLRGNANAIVVDSQSHTTIIADDREGDLLVWLGGVRTSLRGGADEVDEDLRISCVCRP